MNIWNPWFWIGVQVVAWVVMLIVARRIHFAQKAPIGTKCMARASNMGANYPQDCDWPFCGCDPQADKVIAAMQEGGWVHVSDTSDANSEWNKRALATKQEFMSQPEVVSVPPPPPPPEPKPLRKGG